MTEQVVQDAATALTTELKAIDGAFDAGQEEALARAAIFALDKCRKLRVDALIAVTKDKHATIHDRWALAAMQERGQDMNPAYYRKRRF